MKIQYCSDLHLEFHENKAFLKKNPLIPSGEILILAGDIVPFAVMYQHHDFFDWIAENFEHTYWVPGNHEYYYSDIEHRTGILHEKIRPNIDLVNNCTVVVNDVQLIFSTMWTKLSPQNQWIIQQNLSDFQVIRDHGKPFMPYEYNRMYEDCLEFIKMENKGRNSILITQHVPTFLNYTEKYKSDQINEAFAVELFSFIESSGFDYWIFGHHHYNPDQFEIGKTRMLTNQLGYIKYNEQQGFRHDCFINI